MTDSTRHIDLRSIPAMTTMLFKAATARKKKQREPRFLPLRISAKGIRADAARLAGFREICGFEPGDTLPLTYPHIMAFPMHLQLMLEPEFPYKPVGAVHIRNRIRQQRALRTEEVLDFEVHFGKAEQVAKGWEFSIITEVSSAGERVWDDLSVMLLRRGGSGGAADKSAAAHKNAAADRKDPGEAPPYRESARWQLAANAGRRYAAASGDYNPIHLYPLTAKLMGFRRQIMHGMWSKSRTVAHLLPAEYSGPASVDVSFKLPIFLPATVMLLYNRDDHGSQFEMRDGKGEKPHLAGALRLARE